MTSYQTITVEPAVPKRFFLPAGEQISVCDPEGAQPFSIGVEEGRSLDVVRSTSLALPSGTVLRGSAELVDRLGVAVTLKARTSQWVDLTTRPGYAAASVRPFTPDTALRVTHPLVSPNSPFSDLIDPIAPVVAEYRIDAATALMYTVKAGQYIQIINVEGSQCADFLAFTGRHHVEELDSATTRTLNGAAMPQVGLHGKYFSQDMTPMVEIIQDTCGRHDSFLLACTDTFYEDNGYPGHASCTSNFNLNLSSYRIKARKGWPAVNFFFNTQVLSDGAIFGGESWARPGDYVLLRACCDLLCATSSCADDIDPVNGWNPTPIHVRIYEADNTFKKSNGIRISRERPVRTTAETGFTESIRHLTDDFADISGTWLPQTYAGIGEHEEYWALRTRAALMDLSLLKKFEISGSQTSDLLQLTFSRDVDALQAGQSIYGCLINHHGGIIDDGLVFKFAEQSFRYVGNCETDGDWLRKVARERGLDALIKTSTGSLNNVALQGPNSREILGPLIEWDDGQGISTMHDLKYFRFATGTLNGISVLVSRTGYTGELGYELFVHPNQAECLWRTLIDAGKPLGLRPLGMKALNRARIEAGLLASGLEFNSGISPYEAGIGWCVSPNKTSMIGAQALERRRDNPFRVGVGLVLSSNEIAPSGEHVFPLGERFAAGVITSATFSPVLGKSIAMAQVYPEYATPGTVLEVAFIDKMGRRTEAVVGPLAAYDPKKRLVKG